MAATPSSPERTVAVVLGMVGIAIFVLMGLTVGAVTFLGTSSDPERTARDDEPEDEDDSPTTVVRFETIPMPDEDELEDQFEGDPYAEPGLDPSAEALTLVADALLPDDWELLQEHTYTAEDPVVSSPCAPEGWNTGAGDRAIGIFGAYDITEDDQVTVTLSTYASEDLAAADLERARTPAYQDCEVTQRQQLRRLDQEVEVTVLDEDPTAPGVAIAMTETGDEGRVEYDHVIVVGRMRAQLDVCACAGFDEVYLRWVAADIAMAMADVQGLPAPG